MARQLGVADLLVRCLEREGLTAVFGMPGEENIGFVDALARIVELYTAPPANTTVICADELGPVVPRTLPPAPGWSPDGHRVKAPVDYARGPEKTWVYGALRVTDGQPSP